MSFYKNSNPKDERINHLKNKIYAEVYVLVVAICFISFLVKHFVYNLDIASFATELIILFVSGIYFTYRSTKLGIVSAEVEMHNRKRKWPKNKKNFITGVVLGIGISVCFGINSAVQYADGTAQAWYYFFLVTFVSLMIYLPVFFILLVIGNDAIKKRSDKAVDKMLDSDENGENDEKH